MGKGAIAIGIGLILFGLWLTYEVLSSDEAPLWLFIHISALIGIGIALIVLYKEEGKIEQRKDIKKKS